MQYCWQFVPFKLRCSKQHTTPSNIAGNIKKLKICFLANFDAKLCIEASTSSSSNIARCGCELCEENNLSANLLYLF